MPRRLSNLVSYSKKLCLDVMIWNKSELLLLEQSKSQALESEAVGTAIVLLCALTSLSPFLGF